MNDSPLRDRKRRDKPSVRRELNPRPQENCSTGVCSTAVQQLLPIYVQLFDALALVIDVLDSPPLLLVSIVVIITIHKPETYYSKCSN